MYVKLNIQERSPNHFCCGKATSVTYPGCVCSFSDSACNAHTPYCCLWPDPLYNIFPHYFIKGTILGGGVIEH